MWLSGLNFAYGRDVPYLSFQDLSSVTSGFPTDIVPLYRGRWWEASIQGRKPGSCLLHKTLHRSAGGTVCWELHIATSVMSPGDPVPLAAFLGSWHVYPLRGPSALPSSPQPSSCSSSLPTLPPASEGSGGNPPLRFTQLRPLGSLLFFEDPTHTSKSGPVRSLLSPPS